MSKSYKHSRSRKPYTVNDLLLKLTDAVKELEKVILKGEHTANQKIQAINALSGLVGKYKTLIETSELLDRIEALEENANLKRVT